VFRLFKSSPVWAVISFVLTVYVGYLHLQLSDAKGVSNFLGSYSSLLRETAAAVCVNKDDILNVSKRNGWRVDENINAWRTDYGQSKEYVEGLRETPSSIRIYIEPAMPLSKEPGVVFRFNAEGCLRGKKH